MNEIVIMKKKSFISLKSALFACIAVFGLCNMAFAEPFNIGDYRPPCDPLSAAGKCASSGAGKTGA
ncbi:hypothetical protein [Pseudomonas amygdali]|uniref:hypothetical protein n=1 Tax=Pseudomonas amygdali TaxID=47877 RepID=UPI000AD29A3B|nr:hypothetical protein [Pseudomonas amygdali]